LGFGFERAALRAGTFFSSKSDSSSLTYYLDLKLATDAALLVNFDGLLELGRMLILLPCSSVLYKVAADATSLN
jgi:hypothetical protein